MERIGRYELGRKVGSTATGARYVARDPELGREVALDVLTLEASAALLAEPGRLEELRSLSAVGHANLQTVFDAGQHDGHLYVAKEFVEGALGADY